MLSHFQHGYGYSYPVRNDCTVYFRLTNNTFVALLISVLGSGLVIFIQSLLMSPQFGCTEEYRARIASTCALVEGIGTEVAGPLLTAAWTKAIRTGGIGLGLPFLVSAVGSMSAMDGIVLMEVLADLLCCQLDQLENRGLDHGIGCEHNHLEYLKPE